MQFMFLLRLQMNDILFIIAGTGQNEYRYIWSPNILRGMPRGLMYIRIGTWYERKDMREIFNALKGREAVEISEKER